MAMSLAFHIIFAAAGIAMPLMMVIAEWRWLRTRDDTYLTLAKRWAKGTAILFAVGAVSGTVLSFELGLLWPEFMKFAGPIIGMPFSLEGFAFFTEAIFLGIYLYGWNRVSPRKHLWAGVIVALSGALSAVFVVIANAWMNTPTGFSFYAGKVANVDPIAAMMNPSALGQTIHMVLAAYLTTAFVVGAVGAYHLLKNTRLEGARVMFSMAMWMAALVAPIQIFAGDQHGLNTLEHQPQKVAAMEGNWQTSARVPLLLFPSNDISQGFDAFSKWMREHRPDARLFFYETWHHRDQPRHVRGLPLVQSRMSWREHLDADLGKWEHIVDEAEREYATFHASTPLHVDIVPGGQALAALVAFLLTRR